jgi:hypothetical protein
MTTQTRDGEQATREQLYKAATDPRLVVVPPMAFLMVDGSGDPATDPEYPDAVAALYALSYALKFALKKAAGLDYRVAPLEGLWWADDMREFAAGRKGDWRWTMMIAQPEAVTPALIDAIRVEVPRKKALPALSRVRLESFAEGWAAQILHRGPYVDEGPTIERLHRFIREQGYTFDGRWQKHHEIYLSDPTRTAPERLKTILRQPVA